MLLLLLLACTPDASKDDLPLDSEPAAPEVPLDHGLVEACDAAPTGTFDDLYSGAPTVLVYGEGEREQDLAERVYGWYEGYLPGLEVVRWDALTDAQRAGNLMILGSPDTNPLLLELEGLPVAFEQGRFTFGGYRYEEHGHGIALIHPSPFAEGSWVTLYAGNSIDGAWSTFSIPTGGDDYATVRGRGTPQQRGHLCREGDTWGFFVDYDEDSRADWEAFKAGLELTEGRRHLMYYAPGSSFAAVAESYTERHAQDHDAALARLEVEALDQPIAAYWYETNALKGEVTGNSGNAHANSQNVEAHHVYNTELDAGGPHEDVHVIAWHRIGDTNYALMGEGLAVWVTGPWWGEPLEDHVSGYKARGVLPSLEALITDFWSMPDGVTYPTAGHFVGWLAEGWGVDVVKRLYVEPDLEAGFQRELGMTLEEVEAAWVGSIP